MKTKIFLSGLFLLLAFTSPGQWSYDNLSGTKYRQGVATLGTKAYFIAGANDSVNLSQIEIYDVSTNTWDSAINISVPRSHPSCAAAGDKIIVAGGIDFFNFVHYDEVDIWDTQTKEWTVKHLLFPRFSIGVLSYGNKVLFAGGANLVNGVVYDVVEIYDIETGEWDFTTLSMARVSFGCAVVNDLAIFAGGYNLSSVTDRVDIYNFTTGTWTTAALSEPRGFLAATTVGSKVIFAGGVHFDNTISDRVDIYVAETNTWSISSLSEPRAMFQESAATVSGTKAIFAGGGAFDLTTNSWTSGSDVVDIYDVVNDSWSVEHITVPLIMNVCAGVGDHFFCAGGAAYISVDSLYLTSNVEIYIDPFSGISPKDDHLSGGPAVSVYPNPTHGIVDIRFTVYDLLSISLKIYNAQGQEVATVLDGMCEGDQVVRWDMSGLPAGVYYYRLTVGGQRSAVGGKIVKY